MKPAAAYARFSSENQREESIDAQLRAIKYFASKYDYEIVAIYTDKAKTGKTDDRPGFQQMIADSAKKKFKYLLVHKLDRLARNSTDTLLYERMLNQNDVEVISVLERLDDTPEGRLMKMIIIGMNEFYSLNLAREVMKGLKENAYNCKYTGGLLPLGYDLDENKHYIINEREAEAVRIIFDMYLKGHGYGDIINTLNAKGYKTKLGRKFGKNSIYEILRNEKYTGTYVYNKTASQSKKGTFNRHKYKDEKDIIKIEGGIPAIISKEVFMEVQKMMDANKQKNAQHKAKAFYLLSGLLTCGECKGALTGETRRYRNKEYSYYVCTRQKRDKTCSKKAIHKEILEEAVIKNLNEKIFNKRNIKNICKRIYESYQKNDVNKEIEKYKKEIASIDIKIKNLYKAIENGLDIEETTKRINERKEEKNQLEIKLIELTSILKTKNKTLDELITEFSSASIDGLPEQMQKAVIQRFVSNIIVYGDAKKGIKIRVLINPNKIKVNEFLDMNGGEGALPPISQNACYFVNGVMILDIAV